MESSSRRASRATGIGSTAIAAWWRSNYSRFALFGGGYYYWDSGYWYPAYGYDPYFSTYVYDAPIYGYNDLEPGQVIASVQAELQRRGYDPGAWMVNTVRPRARRFWIISATTGCR